jgi:hypothetical protein
VRNSCPGATGLGIGLRKQDGELSDKIAFRVMVEDPSQIPDGLPETLAGVDICVVEGERRGQCAFCSAICIGNSLFRSFERHT